MGEFHFARCPRAEWREELLRMKAGGVDIVATYVFWIHHEEIEGEWDWTGRRDLREFIRLCDDVGVVAAVRIGPWCHGEVRNGGVPDWAIDRPWRLRSNDPDYLQQVRKLYGKIAEQLEGMLWKDGGPVIAIQLENEYRGRAEHLLELKAIARDVGLDAPVYTRTGWPPLATPMPFGEIAPLYGAYAEGFWDRRLTRMPGKYWAAFRFMHVRTDAAIATEQLGDRAIRDEPGAAAYPFLTCEVGGGMMSSYHRRLWMHAEDVEAVALTKVGSGGNLPGYYMYHGGVNPDGRRTTLMEDQSTRMTNYNDMPIKNYDFQAPLGAYGQTRPHYHGLRQLHLMFRDFGDRIAPMPSFLPERLPGKPNDTDTLRWAVRSDGVGGFLFVNNHQRGATMASHEGVQFAIDSPRGRRVFPESPFRIAPGAQFVWPFGLDFGDGVTLDYATAQLICSIDDDRVRRLFFRATPGVAATFAFVGQEPQTVSPGRGIGMRVAGTEREVQVVLLTEHDAQRLWKGSIDGRQYVVLSSADVLFDRETIQLRSATLHELTAWVCPPLGNTAPADRVFEQIAVTAPASHRYTVRVEAIRDAGPAREVPTGSKGVATQPRDRDFEKAAIWRIHLDERFDPASTNALLRVRYRGDVARIRIGDRLAYDDFYNGREIEVGLRRYAAELQAGAEITLEILPIAADAPILFPKEVDSSPGLLLESVELTPQLTASVRLQ